MQSRRIRVLETVLNLEKKIIGLRFVDFKDEFESLKSEVPEKKGPLCYFFREAMEGRALKIHGENLTCDYSKYALGISNPDKTIAEGRSYHHAGLYASRGISREIVKSMKYLSHDVYGLEIGPLEYMESADIVVIVSYADTAMRIMQGYSYKFGSPDNLNFFGNQAACGDLVSKPYTNDDINISLMCRGMRTNGRFEKGELGVAIPLSKFDSLVEGVISTINPVSSPKEKSRILSELKNFDLEIDMNYSYGVGLKEYDSRVKESRDKRI